MPENEMREHEIGIGGCGPARDLVGGQVMSFATLRFPADTDHSKLRERERNLHPYWTSIEMAPPSRRAASLFSSFFDIDSSVMSASDVPEDLQRHFVGVGMTASPFIEDITRYTGLKIQDVLQDPDVQELAAEGAIWLPDTHPASSEFLEHFGVLSPQDKTAADKLLGDIRKYVKLACERHAPDS